VKLNESDFAFGLHYHPYKIQVVQKLSERDFIARKAFCEQFLTLVQEEPDVIRRMMSDEAHFELSGCVNKQNMRYWSDNNPQLLEKPLHSSKVTVWCGVSTFGIVGPYFFEDENGLAVSVISELYVQMLNEYVFPKLRDMGIDLARVYFQKDGATAHTARLSMGTYDNFFSIG
jgi:hypothetical protein